MTAVVAVLFGLALVGVCATAVTALLWTDSWADGIVTWGVVAAAAVVAALLVLGVPGWLRPGPLLAVNAVEAAVALLLLGCAGWPRIRRPAFRLRSWITRGPWEAALVLMLGLALGWQLLVALVLPPYAYDALAYH